MCTYGGIEMKEEEKDLLKSEHELQDTLLSVILYLNCNGIPIDRIEEMIYKKVERAFELYESENIRDKFMRNKYEKTL
jgi:NTP pyrophosphatase (non-canonical NTP hydrolase)